MMRHACPCIRGHFIVCEPRLEPAWRAARLVPLYNPLSTAESKMCWRVRAPAARALCFGISRSRRHHNTSLLLAQGPCQQQDLCHFDDSTSWNGVEWNKTEFQKLLLRVSGANANELGVWGLTAMKGFIHGLSTLLTNNVLNLAGTLTQLVWVTRPGAVSVWGGA